MKVVAGSDEPTVNYHMNLELVFSLWGFMVSFRSLLDVWSINLLFWFTLTTLTVLVLATAGSFVQRKSSKKPQFTKQQTGTETAEHSGAFSGARYFTQKL